MAKGAQQHSHAPPRGQAGGASPVRQRQRGFTLIELIAVIVILGILAAIVVPRYMGITDQAAQNAAEGALAEGANRLRMATVSYITGHQGAEPTALADLSPDHLNATCSLGDYTASFSQSGTRVTIEIYPGSTTSGTPLASRDFPWP